MCIPYRVDSVILRVHKEEKKFKSLKFAYPFLDDNQCKQSRSRKFSYELIWRNVSVCILYIYTTALPLLYSCYLFLSYFGYSTFLGYRFGQMRVNIVIFITFRVHQILLQKVHLNRYKKMGGSRVPRGL